MRKIFLLMFLFCFPAISFSQPAIQFDTENYDFGSMPQRDKIDHTFIFKNTGSEDLVIQRLATS